VDRRASRRYSTLNEAAGRLTGKSLDLFTIEPPVIDFSGLATLYDWKYAKAASESELDAVLSRLHGKVKTNTLLELKLDPSVKPVTASRHF
jgi:2-succinyl-5-enolpyruvyl-6-hydroxy-3-cyclohexene-1-carboxylate synthase